MSAPYSNIVVFAFSGQPFVPIVPLAVSVVTVFQSCKISFELIIVDERFNNILTSICVPNSLYFYRWGANKDPSITITFSGSSLIYRPEMPQEFQVLQCYSCNTFQVHQVKKTTKWACKMCGEKQSLKKVS